MSLGQAAGAFVSILILSGVCWGIYILVWEDQRSGEERDDYPYNGRNRRPPSYKYRHHQNTNDEHHKIAEEYSWRYGLALNIIIAIAALGAAVFAYGSFVETRRQAIAAEQQTSIAQNTLFSSTRPWVFEDTKPDIRVFDILDKRVEIWLMVNVRSIGQQPSFRVKADATIIDASADPDDARNSSIVCHNATIKEIAKYPANAILPPDQTIFPDRTAKLNVLAISGNWGFANLHVSKEGTVTPKVVGCIVYEDQAGHLFHTPFLYDVYLKAPELFEGKGLKGIPYVEGDVLPGALFLRPDESGAGTAD